MTLHAFIAYIRYRWKAKGRHGIHSPFVYDLTDHVLPDKSLLKKEYLVSCPELPLKYENLICRIAAYYNYKAIAYVPGTGSAKESIDLLLINETGPEKWDDLLREHLQLLTHEGVVIVTGIHKTRVHSVAWKKLTTGSKVRMSIDLYGIGLLFFKEAFKERQHFVLKY